MRQIVLINNRLISLDQSQNYVSAQHLTNKRIRRMAENGFAPPLGNFADIFYLVENRKPSLLRDVCTLCVGALVCKSL